VWNFGVRLLPWTTAEDVTFLPEGEDKEQYLKLGKHLACVFFSLGNANLQIGVLD
jgi:hypothetical protein